MPCEVIEEGQASTRSSTSASPERHKKAGTKPYLDLPQSLKELERRCTRTCRVSARVCAASLRVLVSPARETLCA